MKDKKLEVIKCPVCGCEYLPGEIYLPEYFVGQPTEVLKRYESGEIMDYCGNSMDLEEHFICERCSTPFKVTAKVSFSTVEEANINFDKDYVTSLKKESLFLDEN